MNQHAHDIAREFAQLLRARLGDHIKQIILFGSQARGDAQEGSDYDVLVVVDHCTPEVEEVVLEADVEMMNRHETLFASLLYSEEEWRKEEEFPFGWNVQREGIAV
jgi:uncharacterized protein